jgi:RNA polymerase sigma factor (sigma-70 family)
MEFAPLNEYLTIAKKVIARFAPDFYPTLAKDMLKDEDAISDVAYALMEADWKWNPEYRSKTGTVRTKRAYRNQKAIWAIQTYMQKKNRKHKSISLSYCSKDSSDNSPLSGIIADKKDYNPLIEIINKDTKQHTQALIDTIFNAGILTDSQIKYIKGYYLEDKTLREVGELYGVSREAVRQGVEKGLEKLKELI